MKSLKVRDSMSTHVITFAPKDSVVQAKATLLNKGFSGAPVIDEVGSLIGILSEVDLIQVVVKDSYYDDPAGIVADFMQTQVECGSRHGYFQLGAAIHRRPPTAISSARKWLFGRSDFSTRCTSGRNGIFLV